MPSSAAQIDTARNRVVKSTAAQPTNDVQYDDAGNVTAFPVMSGQMTYDAENRLTSMQTATGAIATYGYDGQGRRVTKTVAGTATFYVYGAGGELLAEYGGAGGVSGTVYQTEDHLGSTRAVTDASGRIVSRSDYLPFGETIAGTAIFNRNQWLGYGQAEGTSQTFTGHVGDGESGLDYFGARYFSGAQGRFTSPDPEIIPSNIANPQAWNKYAYTFNNPRRFTDPDGKAPQETVAGQNFERDARAVLSGQMSKEEFQQRNAARAAGAAAGAGIGFAPEIGAFARGLWYAVTGYLMTPKGQETAASIAESVSDAPPGSLTSQFARLGATTAESVERKLSQYLLNPEHVRGGDKAEWFQQALGLTKENMADLAKQIVFDPKKAVQTGLTEFGTKYNQTITITGANGRNIDVVAAWIRIEMMLFGW